MYGKLSKNIGFSLLPFAFLFLFEPNYTLYDVLPDCIGYFIICLAIINMADINIKVREAFAYFRRAIFISLAKYLAIYLLDKFFVDIEQNVSLLLFTFVFSFLELIVLIPAYKKLFEGFLSLGLLYGGEAVYYSKKAGKPNLTEKAFRFTLVFLTVQKLCAMLPEFTTLISHDFYEFIILLRVFGIIIVIPFGIIWLVKTIKYCYRVKKDEPFIKAVSDLYEEKANANPHFFTVRVLSTGLLILAIGLVASIDIYSDGVNLLPDYFCYGAILFEAAFLMKYSKKWLLVAISSLLGLVVSVFLHISNNYFAKNFYFSEISKEIDAYNAYYTTFFLKIAEAVFFVATITAILVFLWDIYKNYSDLARIERGREHRELKKIFVSGTITLSILAVLTGASGVFYYYAQPFYYTAWYYYYSMIISVAVNFIFAIYVWFFLESVKSAIKRRYSLYL